MAMPRKDPFNAVFFQMTRLPGGCAFHQEAACRREDSTKRINQGVCIAINPDTRGRSTERR